jgi:Lhr-like helicase
MFAYNYMITSIRAITQELDNFNSELSTSMEHVYVDNRSVAEEVVDALKQIFPERAAAADFIPQREPAAEHTFTMSGV